MYIPNSAAAFAPGPQAYANNQSDPAIDGIGDAYDPEMGNHIDTHVSLFVGGQQIGIPMGIGIAPPGPGTGPAIVTCTSGPETGNPFIANGSTFYWIHTHDHGGIVHVEHQTGPAQGLPLQPFTLGQFFAVWGQTISSSGAAGYSGTVRVFLYNDGGTTGEGPPNPSAAPTEWTGDPNTAPFGMHEYDEVAIEVGAPWVAAPLYTWDPVWYAPGPSTCL